jgi:putative phosphoesterase
MRVGLLADVHGNLLALDAVLAALAAERVETHVCLGDLVGYGPRPDECIARVAELGAVCVAGNHDLVVVGRAPIERCGPLARRTLEWTQARLDAASRRFLASLPLEARVHDMVLTHGALGDPWQYVRSDAEAGEQLRRLALGGAERWLCVGHTHQPRTFAADGRRLVNPGAVGQSRDREPLARFAVVDLERGDVRLGATGYDHRACRWDLRRQGLPPDSCHPTRAGVAARVRRVLRRRGG